MRGGGADGFQGVGFGGPLVLAVAEHAGEPQRDAARVAGAALQQGGLPKGLGGLPGLGGNDNNIPAAFRGNNKRKKK